MYVKRVELHNVKCFSDFTLEFPDPPSGERSGGWYVIVGPNGMGKSTILRAIALCLLGAKKANQVHASADRWTGSRWGRLMVHVVGPVLLRLGEGQLGLRVREGGYEPIDPTARGDVEVALARQAAFIAGYGAFRRVGGGQVTWLSQTVPEFVSLFSDDEALDATRWLVDAWVRGEGTPPPAADGYKQLCASVVRLVNQESLVPPSFSMLELSPEGVRFGDPFGRPVNLDSLGDGYRSIVGMVLRALRDLMQWQASPNGEAAGLLDGRLDDVEEARQLPGVVLIDEPDAHLHPSWQREIGFALQRVFPNIQFIVATHSPFICQAASPGGIFQLRMNESEKRIEAVQVVEDTVRGMHIEDIYDQALGVDHLLDVPTQEKREEYQKLEGARVRGELDEAGAARLAALGAELDAELHSPGRTKEEREKFTLLDRLVRQAQASGEEGPGGG